MLRYKGYATILQQDSTTHIWHGRIMNIQDVVSFEGKTRSEAEKEFCRSVDAYLSMCRAIERLPDQPSFVRKRHPADHSPEAICGQEDTADFLRKKSGSTQERPE